MFDELKEVILNYLKDMDVDVVKDQVEDFCADEDIPFDESKLGDMFTKIMDTVIDAGERVKE